MRFYTKQHPFSCGIDLHARTMYLCILNQDGKILVHRNMPAGPDPFLKAVAPSREDLVVCVEGLVTCSWLAARCAREGMPFVLGHALSRKAIHGGKAKNDQSDAQKIAARLRRGMLPQASVSPTERRATRDLLRQRMPRRRKRAELRTHIQHTTSQDTLPEIGKKIADKATRNGVAERFLDPAVQKSSEGDLARIDHDDRLLRALALTILRPAKQHDANTLYLVRTVPGRGARLRLGRRYAIHDLHRCPRVPDCVSYWRLGKCAQEAAGKRAGTAGTKIGNAYLQWAFAEIAGRFVRANPAGQKYLTRWEKNHAQGKALTGLAHT